MLNKTNIQYSVLLARPSNTAYFFNTARYHFMFSPFLLPHFAGYVACGRPFASPSPAHRSILLLTILWPGCLAHVLTAVCISRVWAMENSALSIVLRLCSTFCSRSISQPRKKSKQHPPATIASPACESGTCILTSPSRRRGVGPRPVAGSDQDNLLKS